jgi:hypothetical protein
MEGRRRRFVSRIPPRYEGYQRNLRQHRIDVDGISHVVDFELPKEPEGLACAVRLTGVSQAGMRVGCVILCVSDRLVP